MALAMLGRMMDPHSCEEAGLGASVPLAALWEFNDHMERTNAAKLVDAEGQAPKYLWIGCADSRVAAENLIGGKPGELFTHRNIANMVVATDTNFRSVLQYAVDVLQVRHIIVCGHYDCGGIKAACSVKDHALPLESWLSGIRDVYRLHREELDAIDCNLARELTAKPAMNSYSPDERHKRMVELNVIEQCDIQSRRRYTASRPEEFGCASAGRAQGEAGNVDYKKHLGDSIDVYHLQLGQYDDPLLDNTDLDEVIPWLRTDIQRNGIMITSSYRLDSKDSCSWVLSASMVHWPLRGVLLRWGPRPNAMQFHSMSFTARMWPDGKPVEGCMGMVRTKRIEINKLPAYPDLPDQTCFLFLVDGLEDAATMRSFRFPDPFNAELAALGMLQTDQEQAPLKSGRPYQFQVTAYGAKGEVLGASAWSMPTSIERKRRFTELPLLLWRGLCGILPPSTFKYFLKEHCVVLSKEPSMVIKFKRICLSVWSKAPEFSGIGKNGESLNQQVQVYFSSCSEMKVTEPAKLDRSRRREKPMSQVFPNSDRVNAEDNMIVVLDAFAQDITLNVGLAGVSEGPELKEPPEKWILHSNYAIEDLEEVYKLREANGDLQEPAALQRLFGQGYASYVLASVEEDIVACAQLGRLAVGGYFVLRCDFVINTVLVKPEFRRQGLGRALVEELLHRLPGGKDPFSAWAVVDSENQAAADFLTALGAERRGSLGEVAKLHGCRNAVSQAHDAKRLDLLRYCRAEQELTDEVVLRAGLMPVAMLSAKFEICLLEKDLDEDLRKRALQSASSPTNFFSGMTF
ncbi:Carbonic anhydrase (Carbonate dehydratase) [Durusdinium trenchii]|uniref:carbonic anhydrase n=1 Tax=Durusdinium trenchii TaxID=1381693 RepID=A0ABP0JU02_9DINO